MDTISQISQQFTQFLTKKYQLTAEQVAHPLTLNTDQAKKDFGDLSSQAPLALAKIVGRPPREIATEVAQEFTHPAVEKIGIAGPGFLNFYLRHATWVAIAQQLYERHALFFKPSPLTPQKFNIEFVSANPTGPLHIGHGRGGIVGDVLGNILSFLGHTVTKEFYINDAGSQLDKLGNSLKIRCQQLVGTSIELPEDAYHGEYLIELAKACVKEFGTEVIAQPTHWFAEYGKEKLLAAIKQTLAQYGIKYDVWFSERTLAQAVPEEIAKLKKNNFSYEKDGAVWFKSTEFGDDKDRVLRKANGEYTYVASDIAYLENKFARGFDHLIMILGQDHHSYVVRLKGLAQAMGYDPNRLEIILYQLVTLKESGAVLRMSKRTGTMVTLDDVLETVGTDVARFFYLNRKVDAHLDFDVDLALKKTDENPVYYLQYAYVRTGSILEKSREVPGLSQITRGDTAQLGAGEIGLLKKIIELKEILASIERRHQTHLLTYYLLELAQTFHHYYTFNRVIEPENVPQTRARLLATGLVRETLGLGLELLGISRPQKM